MLLAKVISCISYRFFKKKSLFFEGNNMKNRILFIIAVPPRFVVVV